MRANEFLTEIEKIPANQYNGGKEVLGDYTIKPSTLKPLPGGSGFVYAVESEGYLTKVFIVDPKNNPTEAIAVLELSTDSLPIPGKPLAVETITVDEDYRGRGLAKALYGIVLTIMKRPLTAGFAQTPGGRRNWLSLANISGVEVKGIIQVDHNDPNTNTDDFTDQLMQLGGQFIGQDEYASCWAFDVVPGKGELKPYIKNALSKIYDKDGPTTLLARWNNE
jgi:hypothetical protein